MPGQDTNNALPRPSSHHFCNSLYSNQQSTLHLGDLGLAGTTTELALPKGHRWDQLAVSWGVTQRVCAPWAVLSTQWKMPGSRHGSLHFHQDLSQSHDWLWQLNWTRPDSYSEMSNGKMYQQPDSLSNISTYLENLGFEESIPHELILHSWSPGAGVAEASRLLPLQGFSNSAAKEELMH